MHGAPIPLQAMLFRPGSHASRRFVRTAAMAAALCGAVSAPAGAQSLAVSAFVVSKANCKIDTPNLALAFGTINPAVATTATATATGSVSCSGGKDPTVAVGLTLGMGSHSSGGMRRMQHGTVATEYMTYGASLSPANAIIPKNGSFTFTVNGTVLPSAFQDVMAGSYSDTVSISVAP